MLAFKASSTRNLKFVQNRRAHTLSEVFVKRLMAAICTPQKHEQLTKMELLRTYTIYSVRSYRAHGSRTGRPLLH